MPAKTTAPDVKSSPWSGSLDDEEDDQEQRPVDPLAQGLLQGLDQASRLLRAGRGDLDRLLGRADLPDITGGDPISALATRLDQEADFWRTFALGAMARATSTGRVAQVVSVIAFAATGALALTGGLAALLGAGEGLQRAALILTGALALALGVAVVSWTSSSARKAGQEVARRALTRADQAERRLHRLAVLLALRQADPERFGEALGRLERETTGSLS